MLHIDETASDHIGKLLLATKIYDMHKLAHYVSGGLVVALPGPDEDHNPETQAALSAVLAGRPDIGAKPRAILEIDRSTLYKKLRDYDIES